MVPEPADLRPLEGDLAPLLFALDSSLDGEGDSLDATGDAAHTPSSDMVYLQAQVISVCTANGVWAVFKVGLQLQEVHHMVISEAKQASQWKHYVGP